MKAKTTGRVELNGRIYRRGEIVEVTEDELKARPGCYTPVADAEADKPPAGAPAPLTKAALMAKLDSIGVAYKARDTVEQLQQRLADATDNHPLSAQDAE